MIISPPELTTLKVRARVPAVYPHTSQSLVQQFLPKRSTVQQLLEDSRKLEDLHRAAFRKYQMRAFKQRLRRLPQKLQPSPEATAELLVSARRRGPSLIYLGEPKQATPPEASVKLSTPFTNSRLVEQARRTTDCSKPLGKSVLAPLAVSKRTRALSLPDTIRKLPETSLSPPVRWSSSIPY